MLTKAKMLLLKRESTAGRILVSNDSGKEREGKRVEREEPMLLRGNAGEATPDIA